jgi:hypothetical protein
MSPAQVLHLVPLRPIFQPPKPRNPAIHAMLRSDCPL